MKIHINRSDLTSYGKEMVLPMIEETVYNDLIKKGIEPDLAKAQVDKTDEFTLTVINVERN